jgi:hypothetical protein
MGTFQNRPKISVVRPLHNKGDNMPNYRPMSLLTTFSKVIENVMYSRMSHYLKANNIQVPEQFGFRKGVSTENAALKLTSCF